MVTARPKRLQALAMAMACMLATDLLASVVAFDNRAGTFVLTPSFDSEVIGTLFDPTLPPEAQPGTVIHRICVYSVPRLTGSSVPIPDGISGAANGVQFARESAPRMIVNLSGVEFSTVAAQSFAAGQSIDPAELWGADAALAWNALFQNPVRQPLLGQSPTIGFRSPVPGGYQYGFIELNWQQAPRGDGAIIFMYQPLRWAYESQPNVPIVVPGPGSALAFALLAPLAARRRRG